MNNLSIFYKGTQNKFILGSLRDELSGNIMYVFSTTILEELVEQCGLLTAHSSDNIEDGVLLDKVPNRGQREAVAPKVLVGNGAMYGEIVNYLPTADSFRKVKMQFNSTLGTQLIGRVASSDNSRWYFGIFSGTFRLGWNTSLYDTGIPADTDEHEFIIGNGKLWIDGNLEADSGETFLNPSTVSIYTLATGIADNVCNAIIFSDEIIENGVIKAKWEAWQEITDNAQPDQFKVYDNANQHYIQFSLTHANATSVDYRAESLADRQGVAIARALGKNLFNINQIAFKSGSVEVIEIQDGINTSNTVAETFRKVVFEKFLVNKNTDYVLSFDAQYVAGIELARTFVTKGSDGLPSGVLPTPLLTIAGDGAQQGVFNSGDEEFVYITFFNTWTISDSAEYNLINLQVEAGTTPTAYEPWTGIFKDALATIPYSDGQPITAYLDPNTGEYSTTLSKAYDVNGDRVAFTGDERYPIAKNLRVVDGVLDNGANYENWSPQGYESVVYSSEEVCITANGTNGDIILEEVPDKLLPNTDYLCVYNLSENASNIIRQSSADVFISDALNNIPAGVTGEVRRVRTTKATVGLNHVLKPNVAFTGNLCISFACYPASQFTDPLTDPLPTSQQPVSGNSITPEQLIAEWVQADVNEDLHDNTDPVNPTRKVVAIDDLEPDLGDQWFIDLDDDGNIIKSGFFNEPLVSPCLEKAQKYFNTTINFNTSDDEVFNTSDGDDFHVVP